MLLALLMSRFQPPTPPTLASAIFKKIMNQKCLWKHLKSRNLRTSQIFIRAKCQQNYNKLLKILQERRRSRANKSFWRSDAQCFKLRQNNNKDRVLQALTTAKLLESKRFMAVKKAEEIYELWTRAERFVYLNEILIMRLHHFWYF